MQRRKMGRNLDEYKFAFGERERESARTSGSFGTFLVFCGPVRGVKWRRQEVVM